MLGVGMVIGAVLGAGIALLVAPETGSETRHRLSRRARSLRSGASPWKKLGRELRRAAAAKRKSLEMQAKRDEVEARRAQKAPG